MSTRIELQTTSTPSGIAYFEPNDMLMDLPSFADYDAGWLFANGLLKRPKPAYPLYYQSLDMSAVDPSETLSNLNYFGNYLRFTRPDGTTTPITGSGQPFVDHLTGIEWIRLPSTGVWAVNLAANVASGYYLPTQAQFISLRKNNSSSIIVLGHTFASTQGQSFCSTDNSNTNNYLGSSNTQVPFASFSKGASRPTTLYCKIWTP